MQYNEECRRGELDHYTVVQRGEDGVNFGICEREELYLKFTEKQFQDFPPQLFRRRILGLLQK